jgi:chemotaxis response regulator CheB
MIVDFAIIVTCFLEILDRQALIQVVDTEANNSEALHKAKVLAPDLVMKNLHMKTK